MYVFLLQEQVDRYVRNQDITYIYNVLENTNVAFMLGGNSSYESEIKYPAIYTPMPISITQESRAIDILIASACCTCLSNCEKCPFRENNECAEIIFASAVPHTIDVLMEKREK